MKTYLEQKLKDILDKHGKRLENEAGGFRADLCRANLSGANLSCANLSGANLASVNLSGVSLYLANLRETPYDDKEPMCKRVRK